MSTGTQRAVEVVVGLALMGYAAYSVYAGSVLGKFRAYTRSEQPGSFWATVLITFAIGLVFLLGFTAWRK